MRRYNRVSAVYRKELMDILRDRRTMAAMVIIPVVLYPLVMLGFIRMAESEDARLRAQEFGIAVPDEVMAANLASWFSAARMSCSNSRLAGLRLWPCDRITAMRWFMGCSLGL